jgi:hypothetical protein
MRGGVMRQSIIVTFALCVIAGLFWAGAVEAQGKQEVRFSDDGTKMLLSEDFGSKVIDISTWNESFKEVPDRPLFVEHRHALMKGTMRSPKGYDIQTVYLIPLGKDGGGKIRFYAAWASTQTYKASAHFFWCDEKTEDSGVAKLVFACTAKLGEEPKYKVDMEKRRVYFSSTVSSNSAFLEKVGVLPFKK